MKRGFETFMRIAACGLLLGCETTAAVAPGLAPDALAEDGAEGSEGGDAVEPEADGAGDVSPEVDDEGSGPDAGDALLDAAHAGPDIPDASVEVSEPGDTADAGDPIDADETSAAPTDAEVGDGPTPTPWGPIDGACGAMAAALADPAPSFHVATWTLEADTFDAEPLAPGPAARFAQPNAGGSSLCTEVMSMQQLITCEGAIFYKKEVDISYDAEGAIADYIVDVGPERVGVSVTRAYLGPFTTEYSVADATTLLDKKLPKALEASANVSAEDAWSRTVLHIWTLHADWADTVLEAWEALPDAVRADVLVWVTVEQGGGLITTDACDD